VSGKLKGAVNMLVDITNRKLAEVHAKERFKQSNRTDGSGYTMG